jgi:homoserine dehydrogenase
MIQNVFVVGTGNVGGTVVRQIFDKGDTDASKHKNPTRIVGLAHMTRGGLRSIHEAAGIDRATAIKFCEGGIRGDAYGSLGDVRSDMRSFPEKLVYADITAARESALDFHLGIMADGSRNDGVVTANKNPLVLCSTDAFDYLTRDVDRYGYRCSVMAGAEAVAMMRDLRDVNDPPFLVEGCFSGTLGFLATGLQEGGKLSKVVTEARKRGYTEPHPRDDLSGADVAKKLLILARTAGFELNYGDIEIEPFIDRCYLKEDDPDEFMRSLPELDAVFAKKSRAAEKRGNTLRYVASFDRRNGKPVMKVGLREVPLDSPLGMLHGTGNKITIVTGNYTENKPYIVEAPGAGPEVTAQNVRRDLLAQLNGRRMRPYK